MALVEGAPNPKRMRLQHSFEGKNKACLILHCLDPQPLSGPSMSRVTYNIFIVDDLNADIVDDGFAPVSPTLQIDCGFYQIPDAFCVLGGTLYMFEGCIDGSGGKSVFAIDLALTRTLTQEMRKLEKGGALLKKIGEVSSPKAFPVALPTPDGEKIVVFSTENFAGGSVFEIFEPVNGSCKQLPSIPGFWNSIDLYGFIDNSQRLLVQTQTAAIYVMDLTGDRRWVETDASAFYSGLKHIPPHHAESSFFEAVLGRRFCCVNLFGFYDLESHVAEGNPLNAVGYRFTSPVSFGLGLPRGCTADSCVSLLNYDEEDGKEILFCHLVMEKPSEGYAESCRLAISVCRVDLESYKKKTDELKSEGYPWSSSFVKRSVTALVKVHKFTLAFDEPYYVGPPHLFFTF